MAPNTTPIFPKAAHVGFGKVTTANTALDGQGTYGTTVILLFTAAAEGSRIDEIRLKHLGTNIATALRIYLNDGVDGHADPTHNTLLYDKTIAANTLSQVAEAAEIVIWPDFLVLPAGYKLYASVGTTIAAGIQITVLGGDY
jgi:hypothetical protein